MTESEHEIPSLLLLIPTLTEEKKKIKSGSVGPRDQRYSRTPSGDALNSGADLPNLGVFSSGLAVAVFQEGLWAYL